MYKDGGIPAHLNSLPQTRRPIVVVHYYLHVLGAHLIVVHDRLVALKAACLRLWQRIPDAVVAFRGPHAVSIGYPYNHTLGGDTQASLYYHLVVDVFHDIRDKVIFLDGWDMSVAIENTEVHPSNKIPQDMIDLLLSMVCK